MWAAPRVAEEPLFDVAGGAVSAWFPSLLRGFSRRWDDGHDWPCEGA